MSLLKWKQVNHSRAGWTECPRNPAAGAVVVGWLGFSPCPGSVFPFCPQNSVPFLHFSFPIIHLTHTSAASGSPIFVPVHQSPPSFSTIPKTSRLHGREGREGASFSLIPSQLVSSLGYTFPSIPSLPIPDMGTYGLYSCLYMIWYVHSTACGCLPCMSIRV